LFDLEKDRVRERPS